MVSETVVLSSTIKSRLMRRVLFFGSGVAAVGVLLLVAASTFLPEELLSYLGIPIIFLGAGLIYLGLAPLRRLQKIERSPSELIVDGGYIQYIALGKQRLSIAMKTIRRLDYFEKGDDYGIAFWLSDKKESAVILHAPDLMLEATMEKCRKRHGCDLFFPYFSRRAYTRLALLLPHLTGIVKKED